MIDETSVVKAMENVKGTTFASVLYSTIVAPSASNKHINITKKTSANVQLFNNVVDYNVYEKAVKRSASKLESNDTANVESFVASGNSAFTHSESCFSIVKNKKTEKAYLYVIYNSASSEYFIDGEPATKGEVAQYLTPSASKKLLGDSLVHNQENDVVHDVVVRTISLNNINQITVCGTILK
jgi:hypothetical protein